jgi:chloramphenicol-sensitive protein RarD
MPDGREPAAVSFALPIPSMSAQTPGAAAVPSAAAQHRSGLLAAIGAFLFWGVFPLYLNLLAPVPALEILAHRIVWCCVFVLGWVAVRGELGAIRAALANPGSRLRLAGSGVLISINWLTYVWAINNGHVIDASLGYFINPLVSVLLGVVVLSERLNRAQWTAVGIAAAGVIYLALVTGRPPWISLVLALSFGLYGLIRKVVAVESLPALATETLVLTPLAAGYLLWVGLHGSGAFGRLGMSTDLLLLGSGIATAVPLALFAYGARRIPLSTVGLTQYLAPTMQFLLGVFFFGEPFTRARAIGFTLIWCALAIYAADGLRRSRNAAHA